jgi:hypothetical protein
VKLHYKLYYCVPSQPWGPMLRNLFLAFAVSSAASAGAALAADQPLYAPPSAWVRVVPIPPPAPAGQDGGPTKLLLVTKQAKLSPDGEEFYSETASQILTPQGLTALGNLQNVWDPATETLTIHKLQVLRRGKVIDLLAGGRTFTVLRRETNLDWAMLDGRLTATFQPEGLEVGDVLDIATTLRRRDPALKGYSTDYVRLDHQGVASHVYLREMWPTAMPIRWRLTEGLQTPRMSKGAEMTELLVDSTNVETPKAPLSAPARFNDLGTIEVSQFSDWAELSELMAPLYDKAAKLAAGSALQREAARIAAASTDPKARALAALRLVEDQVRYVFLGMNDGGLVPANAEETWARRFGDCKGKTALLVGLLRELGVEAEPALVNTNGGDGMDARLPAMGWFDHAIVRAHIGGKVYWLDGTRTGDRSLDTLIVPPFGWALPVSNSGTPLERLTPTPLAEPWVEQAITIDASKGDYAAARTRIVIVYRGEYAVGTRAAMANASRADYDRAYRDFLAKTYSWFNVATLDIRDEVVGGVVRMTAEGAGKLDWTQVSDGSRVYRVPGSAFAGQITKRQPGPNADAPYVVPFPGYTRSTWRIVLPSGPRYSLYGHDVERTLAGTALKRSARMSGGVLSIEISGKSLGPEFPNSEADAAGEAMRDLGRNDVAVVLPAPTIALAPLARAPAPKGPQRIQLGMSADAMALVASQIAQSVAADQAAAAGGDATAQFRLSQRYAHGDGVAMNPAQAAIWLQKAAETGNADAEVELGEAYLYGSGMPVDRTRAAASFRKAADQGNVIGQRLLAVAYLRGEGVPADQAIAVTWLERAAAQGDGEASRLLELMRSPVAAPGR